MTPRLHTTPDESPLLGHLVRLLPTIAARLDEAEAWRGLLIRDTRVDTAYVRLVCRDLLVSREAPPRQYLIGAHCFDKAPSKGQLHNHRFPLAVLPFGEGACGDETLYEMPWEARVDGQCVDRGLMRVRSGRPYAMEPCLALYHAVHSLRPHMSISLADVTEDPARPDRLDRADLPAQSTERFRRRLLAALIEHMARP